MITGQDGFIRFPAIETQDSLKFYFAKNLSYRQRLRFIFLLIIVGFTVQIATLNPIWGIPLVVAGSMLGLVKGYDSRIRLKNFKHDAEWSDSDIEKVRQIDAMRQKVTKWDRDALDVSNSMGCFFFILLMGTGLIGSFVLGGLSGNISVFFILFLDFILLVVPFYFTGMRFILKQDNLAIKVKILLSLYDFFQKIKKEGENFKLSMMLARDAEGKTVPTDLKFAIKFDEMPKDFYGIQAQTNLNVVQGTSYPYFYCVVVAKEGYGLAAFQERIVLPKKVICEFETSKGADVLIIRQETTKKTGYHTPIAQCGVILQTALEGARLILNK